jgi:hypothetical protein
MFNRIWRRDSNDSVLKSEIGSPSTNGTADRRTWVRVPLNRETIYRVVNSADSAVGQVRNVSQGGINLIVARPLKPGTMLTIDLPHVQGAPGVSVLACVMHCSEEGAFFSIGCTFSSELGDSELKEFGGRRVPAQGSDQRTWTRFPAHGNAQYQRVADHTVAQPSLAEITNISPSGIGLIMKEPIEPGTVLNLGLHKKGEEDAIFQVLACVVFLGERREGGWLAGCNFIHELPEREFNKLV